MRFQDLNLAAFPRLDEKQMETLARCPEVTLKRYSVGQKLVSAGQCSPGFHVIGSGKVDVVDDSAGIAVPVAELEAGEFTGEISQLTGAPSVVTVVARNDCEAYEIPSQRMVEVLNRYPEISDLILQAFIARRHLLRESPNFQGIRIIGPRHSRDTHRVRNFLSMNLLPFTWLDPESGPQVNQLLKQFRVTQADLPVVTWGESVMRNPSELELAKALGLRKPLERITYDLVIVGAGPAGLAAAVYAASEGLNTIVLERMAPGGQAGRSMRIENYPGFPIGMTGAELAERAFVQATKFGARLPMATTVDGLSFENGYAQVRVDESETATSKCLLIATGADYRRLGVENCETFEGCGVYYAATPTEAQLCRGSTVVVVGGGNSAGQAAVFLAANTRKVHLLVRADSLYKDMSSYLARRIEQTPNIDVHCNSVVRRLSGDKCLSSVEIQDNKTGQTWSVNTPALFSFIGAVPRTDWLGPEIEKDEKGFVRTGLAAGQSRRWDRKRPPFLLETTHPGVFAAGDVRSGSIKRVASAVGEGAIAVQFIHEYLKEM